MIVVLAMVDNLPDDLTAEMCEDALYFARVRPKVVTDPQLKKDLEHAEKVLMARISEKEAEA